MGVDPKFLLFGSIIAIFVAFAFFVWGFVPDDVEEDEIYGYRLTKRKRLIEEDASYAMVLPLVKVFAHYFRRLPDTAAWKISETRSVLRDKLMRSGFMGAFTANEFLGMCCVAAMCLFVVGLVFSFLMTNTPQIPVAFIGAGVGFSLPFMSLNSAMQQRLIDIDRRLPYTVDLLVLSMRAGLDFMTALDRVVTRGQIQNPDDPMVQELGVVLQEMRVGTARSDALINLCERVKSEYLNSMVGAILQSEKRGTPLANVLEIQVDTIRNKRTAKIEKAASQAAVKILFPLMFIFGAVVLVVLGAMILKIMAEGN
ncbi:MAG: type II secretion system F family protein [Bradymonadaceae bacterium]|nr:type II secretion system F family protein [Lujinxingiaceae bacterium]